MQYLRPMQKALNIRHLQARHSMGPEPAALPALPEDVLGQVAKELQSPVDLLSLRNSCTAFRHSQCAALQLPPWLRAQLFSARARAAVTQRQRAAELHLCLLHLAPRHQHNLRRQVARNALAALQQDTEHYAAGQQHLEAGQHPAWTVAFQDHDDHQWLLLDPDLLRQAIGAHLQSRQCRLQRVSVLARRCWSPEYPDIFVDKTVSMPRVCHRPGPQHDAELCDFLQDSRELLQLLQQSFSEACASFHLSQGSLLGAAPGGLDKQCHKSAQQNKRYLFSTFRGR